MSDLAQRISPALGSRYRLERELGRGGMATVFLAEDLKHHRQVAIKVLDPEVAAAIGPERFRREIETVAKLAHPHVLPLHDSGEAGGLLFYVMPFVVGESLRDRLARERQLPLEEALRLVREVADALGYAHRQGVVHRDIKPENILLEEGHALVADFGVARAAAGAEKLTVTGVSVGTPAYMSPEQVVGGAADARSDLYALGCMLYEMLAGQAPFTGPTAESVVFQHLNATPPQVTAMRPAVPAGLDPVIAKAMAKSPADRFATTAEFVAALEAGLAAKTAPGPTAEPEVERPATRRAAVLSAVVTLGVVLALVAVAAWQQWWPFDGGSMAPAAKKDWILVAEFDGPPGDSTLAPAARSLLSAALDQSRIVATVSQDQIQQALQSAGKPPGTQLTPAVAKELAYRSAVRTVLEGTIGRMGTGYTIVLRLVDADTARVLFTESGTAKGDDALIPVMGELAKKLRHGLGENRGALAATRPMVEATTPSFEAYRLYVQAMRKQGAGEWTDAIAFHRQALALDPDFAMAWGEMSWCFQWRSTYDSVRVCISEALRRPNRLTSVQRQMLEIRLAGNEGDARRALALTEQLERQAPTNISVLDGSWELLFYGHARFKQSLDWVHRAMRLSPFGPTEEMRIHEIWDLVGLGRFDEARAAQRHLAGKWKTWVILGIELGDGRFAVAESIATAHLDDPEMTREWPIGYRTFLFSAQAGRGAVQAAAGTLDQSMAIARAGAPGFQFADQVHQGLIMDLVGQMTLSSLSRGAVPLPPDTCVRDNSTESLIARGLRAAFAGDGSAARRILTVARARPQRDLRMNGASIEMIEARAELQAGRPEEAVRLLRPIAAREVEPWPQIVPVGLAWVRWTLADAFEQMGKPDSAAAYLERSASSPASDWSAPYLHQRLALLDGRMGRVAEAERHLAAVEKAWDRPDPPVRRLLDEARTVVRASRGIARPERAGS
jgi:eukaryotic-like serine/threonine-protein kinase